MLASADAIVCWLHMQVDIALVAAPIQGPSCSYAYMPCTAYIDM